MSKNYIDLLDAILEAIEVAEKICHHTSSDELKNDDIKRYALVRAFEVIGGVSKELPMDIKNLYADLDWSFSIKMRDILSHVYIELDTNILYSTVIEKLPYFKQGIIEIKTNLLKTQKDI